MTLGEYIKEQRDAHEMSQRELGRRIGVTGTTVGRLESGIMVKPSIAILNAVAQTLNLDRNRLYQLAGNITVVVEAEGLIDLPIPAELATVLMLTAARMNITVGEYLRNLHVSYTSRPAALICSDKQ